jgi:hypothetical protein
LVGGFRRLGYCDGGGGGGLDVVVVIGDVWDLVLGMNTCCLVGWVVVGWVAMGRACQLGMRGLDVCFGGIGMVRYGRGGGGNGTVMCGSSPVVVLDSLRYNIRFEVELAVTFLFPPDFPSSSFPFSSVLPFPSSLSGDSLHPKHPRVSNVHGQGSACNETSVRLHA